jgi:RimJ/RimL family protein N-acetyltransferase
MSTTSEVECPERIHTARLLLRCWRAEDAPLLKDAIDGSLEHLRRFMPWAWDEPSPVEVFAERVERYRADFLAGREWRFGVFPPSDGEVLGMIGIHRRGPAGTLDFGYWLRSDAVGHGYMTEAAAALTDLALRRLRADRVEIRCNALNEASSGIPRRLGYRLEQTLQEDFHGEPRTTRVWATTADERSPASAGR